MILLLRPASHETAQGEWKQIACWQQFHIFLQTRSPKYPNGPLLQEEFHMQQVKVVKIFIGTIYHKYPTLMLILWNPKRIHPHSQQIRNVETFYHDGFGGDKINKFMMIKT